MFWKKKKALLYYSCAHLKMYIIYILPSGAGKHTQKNENNSTTVRSNTDDGDTYIFR